MDFCKERLPFGDGPEDFWICTEPANHNRPHAASCDDDEIPEEIWFG